MKHLLVAMTLLTSIAAQARPVHARGENPLQLLSYATTYQSIVASIDETARIIVEATSDATTKESVVRKIVAEQIKSDAQEFYQTNSMSPLLKTFVAIVDEKAELSDSEAVDLLVEYANEI